MPCAQQPSVPGMTCRDFPHLDGDSGSVLVNDKLRLRDIADAHPRMAVTVAPRDGDPADFHRMDGDMDECGESFFAAYDYDHPIRSDCEAIMNWAADNKGFWRLSGITMPAQPESLILLQSGSCAFSVTMDEETKSFDRFIGNQDVADLLRFTLDDDTNGDDKTGLRGFAACNTPSDGKVALRWWIVTTSIAAALPDLIYPSPTPPTST
ncbi:hypothetical protein F4820DRAFT_464411 [Hypoxylon rubiginosum]|uniref:Uncharacterized protein n=1 Tax=Hypoxylon rubiginosum TaxID=110542 RepID=A0ACB9YS17_9PEZI|nr:hypothetical protein F4820DRAFT_464411 [Hypoxylon rubiginosum]